MASNEPPDDAAVLEEARTSLNRWYRRMIGVGIALILSAASVIPFLDGHSLHTRFETIGKYLIYLSLCLLSLFVGSAALTYNFWSYWRSLGAESRTVNSHPK